MVSEVYRREWQAWHDSRIKYLNKPTGWLSLTAQIWLDPDKPTTIPGIPGAFTLHDDSIIYTPANPVDTIDIDGHPATQPTVIPWGFNEYSIDGNGVTIAHKDVELETMRRTNGEGHRIYSIRIHDPKEAARKQFSDINTYPLDDKWIVPAHFTPAPSFDLVRLETVIHDVRETLYDFGTLRTDINGQSFDLLVRGIRTPAGYSAAVHLRDKTNGVTTYGAGRFVQIPLDEIAESDVLDLNYLIMFPCAFTNYVTCPLPPAQNTIPFEITAGEKLPPVSFGERIQTYRP